MKTKIDAISTIISAMPSYSMDYPDMKKDSAGRLYVPALRNGKTCDYARIEQNGKATLLLRHSLRGAAYIIGIQPRQAQYISVSPSLMALLSIRRQKNLLQ